VNVPDAFPVPPGSWRLSWDEPAERTDATCERLQRLVELGILTPTDANQPFCSWDIHRVRAVAALERSGVAPEQIATAMAAGELSFGYLDYRCATGRTRRNRKICDRSVSRRSPNTYSTNRLTAASQHSRSISRRGRPGPSTLDRRAKKNIFGISRAPGTSVSACSPSVTPAV
jgi:hypothetical protein